jgi:hypothetical protein
MTPPERMGLVGERSGKVPEGWVKHGIQLPTDISMDLRRIAEELGVGGMKHLATLGMGATVGMPAPLRRLLLLWLITESWSGKTVTAEEIWAQVVRLALAPNNAVPIQASSPPAPSVPMVTIQPDEPVRGPTHEVSKIVIPAVPPPKPGSRRKAAEG